jgi:hypothetical protein
MAMTMIMCGMAQVGIMESTTMIIHRITHGAADTTTADLTTGAITISMVMDMDMDMAAAGMVATAATVVVDITINRS